MSSLLYFTPFLIYYCIMFTSIPAFLLYSPQLYKQVVSDDVPYVGRYLRVYLPTTYGTSGGTERVKKWCHSILAR